MRFQLIKFAILATLIAGISPKAMAEFDHKHEQWNSILSRHVSWNGSVSTVDYKGIKADPKALIQYLDTLTSVPETEFNAWKKPQQLSFLINAYNAWTIKLIVDHYPVRSIKDIGGFFSSPWKQKIVRLFGSERSLDWIEHERIRPVFKEPRIHFALVCASKGCPGLRSEAYQPDSLDQQLEESTRRFLTDQTRNSVDTKKMELSLSSIFKWYKDDFVAAKGSVENFVLPYMSNDGLATNANKFKTSFKDYDWSLNENHNSRR